MDNAKHPESYYYLDINGEKHLREEQALARLLEDHVLFANARKYIEIGEEEPEGPTIVLFVNCNDLFYWGCADAECLPYEEIGNVLTAHLNDARGTDKWCCMRRKLRPQKPIEKLWRKNGWWDEELEALPKPEPS